MRLALEWFCSGLEALAVVLFGPPEEHAVTENRVLRARRDELKLAEENILLRAQILELEKRAADRAWSQEGDQ